MTKKIRVEGDCVVECMNENEIIPGAMDTGDWRDAVEVPPQLIAGKQILDGHWFDLSKNPVEIHWNIKNLTVEERKQPLLHAVEENYKTKLTSAIASEQGSAELIEEFMKLTTEKQQKKAVIAAIISHQEIDDYIANSL